MARMMVTMPHTPTAKSPSQEVMAVELSRLHSKDQQLL